MTDEKFNNKGFKSTILDNEIMNDYINNEENKDENDKINGIKMKVLFDEKENLNQNKDIKEKKEQKSNNLEPTYLLVL